METQELRICLSEVSHEVNDPVEQQSPSIWKAIDGAETLLGPNSI